MWRPHLVFLVHGMNGSSATFDHVVESLLAAWGEEIVVHACISGVRTCNTILPTKRQQQPGLPIALSQPIGQRPEKMCFFVSKEMTSP